MGVIDSERNCFIVLVCCSLLIIGGLFGVLGSFETAYYADEIAPDSDRGPINTSNQSEDSAVYYHNFSTLSDSQQDEFLQMTEDEYVKNLTALNSLGELPLHIQYQGDKYIIQSGLLFSFETPVVGWLSVIGVLLGIIGCVYAYERRVDLRLQRLRDEPLSVIDSEESVGAEE